MWGPSYAGHVLVLGATDRRIRAVVAQVPTISGYEQGLRRVPPEAVAALEHQFDEDERAQLRGGHLGFSKWSMPIHQPQLLSDPRCHRVLSPASAGRCLEERGHSQIRSAGKDVRTGLLGCPRGAHAAADNCRSHRQHHPDRAAPAYEQMLEPKKLVTVEGGHFDPYLKQFSRASDAAVSWFRHHLGVDAHQER